MIISCITIAQYHNPEINIDKIHWSYADITSFTCLHLCLCVYVIPYNFITCVGWCGHHNRTQNSSITRILGVTFYNHSATFLPPPLPNPWKSLICSPFLIILSFQDCYINEIIQHITFGECPFSLNIIPLKSIKGRINSSHFIAE